MTVQVLDMVKSYGFAKLNLPSWYVRKQDQEVIALLIQKKKDQTATLFSHRSFLINFPWALLWLSCMVLLWTFIQVRQQILGTIHNQKE